MSWTILMIAWDEPQLEPTPVRMSGEPVYTTLFKPSRPVSVEEADEKMLGVLPWWMESGYAHQVNYCCDCYHGENKVASGREWVCSGWLPGPTLCEEQLPRIEQLYEDGAGIEPDEEVRVEVACVRLARRKV